MAKYSEKGVAAVEIGNVQNALGEIRELIDVSKATIKHVYEQIASSELCDPEAVQALAKVLESSHLTISEYINLYRDRVQFYDKVRMEQLKHHYRIEEMDHKHKLEMERLDKKGNDAQDVPNQFSFSSEDVVKMLDDEERGG